MLKIFISHASADTDIAVALQGWIHTTFLGGVSVFVSSDGRSISPGDDWRGRIEQALREADIALVICTEFSLARPWLGFEAGAAWMRGAKVVPLCYHGLSVEFLPLPFSSRQALDVGRPEDMNALLAFFIREGGFEASLVERKPLSLPPRRALSTNSQPPDVRATAQFVWLGARTRDLASAFNEPRPAFIFRVENHGTMPVYLEGGIDILLKDGKGKLMLRDFNGVPLLRRDLLPGQSEQVPFQLDEVTPEQLTTWDSAFFHDQVGRQFIVRREDLIKAIDEFVEWWKRQHMAG
jgi:TIR domain-containing protein